jgi:MOSC domain-containing protein YiiM
MMTGTLKGIAHRPVDGEPMREAREANVQPGRGLDTENRKTGRREVTLLAVEAWADACRELGVEVPWHVRRANLLIEGVDLGATLGQVISIGPVQIRIHGETRPCGIMESQKKGLRDALKPNFRGGVHGEVLTGGTIRVGDAVRVVGAV